MVSRQRVRCRSCDGLMMWATTGIKGGFIPVDPDPVDNGNIVLDFGRTGNLPRASVLGPLELQLLEPGVARYVSHFVTCPQADEHRKEGS